MVNSTTAAVLGALFITVGLFIYNVGDGSILPVLGLGAAGALFIIFALLEYLNASPI